MPPTELGSWALTDFFSFSQRERPHWLVQLHSVLPRDEGWKMTLTICNLSFSLQWNAEICFQESWTLPIFLHAQVSDQIRVLQVSPVFPHSLEGMEQVYWLLLTPVT